MTRGSGLRRRRDAGGRPHKVTVRLNDEEYAKVATLASGAGLTPASFLAAAALRGPEGGMSLAAQRGMATELMGLSRILVRSAENLNRLTRIGQGQGLVPGEVPATARALTGYAQTLVGLARDYDPRTGPEGADEDEVEAGSGRDDGHGWESPCS